VTHLVCVLSGAPGPTQPAAAAGEDGTSDAAPSNAVATVPEKYETSFLYLVMNESSHTRRAVSTRRPSRREHCPLRGRMPADSVALHQERDHFFICCSNSASRKLRVISGGTMLIYR